MTQPTPAPEVEPDVPDEDHPHQFDEDPEACIGDEMPDPWTDPAQTDWDTEEVEV